MLIGSDVLEIILLFMYSNNDKFTNLETPPLFLLSQMENKTNLKSIWLTYLSPYFCHIIVKRL